MELLSYSVRANYVLGIESVDKIDLFPPKTLSLFWAVKQTNKWKRKGMEKETEKPLQSSFL